MNLHRLLPLLIAMSAATSSAVDCFDYARMPDRTPVVADGNAVLALDASNDRLCYRTTSGTLVWCSLDQAGNAVVLGDTAVTTNQAYDIVIVDEIAYISNYGGLMAMDWSTPAHPEVVFQTSFLYTAVELALHGDQLWVWQFGAAGLRVYDVSTPASPVQIGMIDEDDVADVFVDGDRCWVTGRGFFRLYDVTDLTAPVLLDEITTSDDGYWGQRYVNVAMGEAWGVAILGSYSYYDDPIGGYTRWSYSTRRLAADRDSLVLSEGASTPYVRGLRVADGVPVGATETGIMAWGDRADGTFGPMASRSVEGSIRDLAVRGGAAWVGHSGGIDRYEGSWSGLEVLTGSATVSWPEVGGMMVSGDRAFVAVGNGYWSDPGDVPYGAVLVFDISDPDMPVSLPGMASFYGEWQSLALLRGEYLYHLFGTTHWPTGEEVGSHPFSWYGAWSVGSTAVYSATSSALKVYDMADPTAPVETTEVVVGARVRGVAESGDRLYAISSGRLHVLDIADPLAPTFVAGYDWAGDGESAIVLGDHLVVGGEGGLTVFDISSPDVPMPRAALASGSIRHFEASDPLLYGMDDRGEVHVFDMTDPGAPVEIGAAGFGGPSAGFGVAHGRVLGLSGDLVAMALQCGDPVGNEEPEPVPEAGRVALSTPVPNPFNPSTTLSFSLDHPGPTNLSIYDLAGRRIRTLADESLPTGNHTRTWRGDDDSGRPMPAGVYLARLRSGDRVESRRMVLLK